MRSFAALLQPAMRLGGVRTPPTSQESAASLALVPNKCAYREWPLRRESAQVVEWPQRPRRCFRQCRPLKMCVMVSRCATYGRPLGWRAHAYLSTLAGSVPYATRRQEAWMSSASLSSCGGR